MLVIFIELVVCSNFSTSASLIERPVLLCFVSAGHSQVLESCQQIENMCWVWLMVVWRWLMLAGIIAAMVVNVKPSLHCCVMNMLW